MATCAPNASPALAAPLVPAPRLAQGWWSEQCGAARLVWRSAPGSRLRRRPRRSGQTSRTSAYSLDEIVLTREGSQPPDLTSVSSRQRCHNWSYAASS